MEMLPNATFSSVGLMIYSQVASIVHIYTSGLSWIQIMRKEK